jgi:hypothetical protein
VWAAAAAAGLCLLQLLRHCRQARRPAQHGLVVTLLLLLLLLLLLVLMLSCIN